MQRHLKASAALLAPSQLGFGIAFGWRREFMPSGDTSTTWCRDRCSWRSTSRTRLTRWEESQSWNKQSRSCWHSHSGHLVKHQYYTWMTSFGSLLKVHNKMTLSGRYSFVWYLKNCWSLDSHNSSLETQTTWLLVEMPRLSWMISYNLKQPPNHTLSSKYKLSWTLKK